MKKCILWICVILCILSFTGCHRKQSAEELAAWEAREISEFHSIRALTFYDLNGKSFQLGDAQLNGKAVVLYCWATRFPASTNGLAAFEEIYQQYGDKIQFLMVNAFNGTEDTMEDAVSYIKDKGYTFPVCFDRAENLKSRNITNFPYIVFLNSAKDAIHIRNTVLSVEEIELLIEDIL